MINVTKQRYWPRHLSLMDILDNTKIIKGQTLYRIMKLSVGCNAPTNKNMDHVFLKETGWSTNYSSDLPQKLPTLYISHKLLFIEEKFIIISYISIKPPSKGCYKKSYF